MTQANNRNLPQYTVKQVAEMTGVSRNQIRLWEQRFNLIEPHRAENGYRLYSEDDLNIIKYLVEKCKVNIHVKNEYALRHASLNGHLNIVKYLAK